MSKNIRGLQDIQMENIFEIRKRIDAQASIREWAYDAIYDNRLDRRVIARKKRAMDVLKNNLSNLNVWVRTGKRSQEEVLVARSMYTQQLYIIGELKAQILRLEKAIISNAISEAEENGETRYE